MAPGAGPLEERKLATVLFADVVGFTSLAERSDPEAVARVVDAAFRRLGEIVAEHGGTVDKYMGDSLMAVFGVPQAHDDDAERAVAAALAMRKVGGDLAFSIGVNTGEVMVTALGRDGAPTVVGDAVNVAARLEKAAGTGEVLVGALTARLAGDRVVFYERHPVVVKGKREPVEVCEAVALRSAAEAATGADRLPLLGRDDELSFLRGQWRRVVRQRRPVVVLVAGDTGVGTTRLVEELVAQVESEALVAWASYPAYGGMGGPRVAAEIAQALGPLGDPEVDARVRSVAGELDPGLREIDPSTFYQEQAWAFRRLLEEKAAEKPVVIVIDDAHRAGERSLDMIGDLVARVTDSPVLLVLVGRPEPSEWLTRFSSATTLHLDALGSGDAVALANALVADLPLDDDAADFLVRRSGGNPLYLRELVAIAKERGGLHALGDRYDVDPSTAIPTTLQAILAARLDSLPPREKLALQHVAVLGEVATADQVEALGLDDADRVMQALAGPGLLRRRLPAGTYEVADPLLAEVAYESLPHHLRAERHRHAASSATTAEERSRHLERALSYVPDDASLRAETAGAFAATGGEFLDAFRHLDAARVLGRAIELGDDTPATRVRLAEAHQILGHNEEVLAVLDGLPADTGDPVIEAQRVHLRAATVMFDSPEVAADELDEAARRWAGLGNLAKEAWAHANRGAALFNLSRMREASASLERALPLFRQAGDRGGEHAVHSFLGLVRPHDPRVPDWLEDGLRYADDIGDRSRQLGALVSLAWHHYLRARLGGDADTRTADDYATRLASLGAEVGGNEFHAHGTCMRSNLARLAGRLDDARNLAEQVRHYLDDGNPREATLSRAVIFGIDITDPACEPATPLPVDSADPVVAVSALIVGEAQLLAGRADDATAYFDATGRFPALGPVAPVAPGLTSGLAHVLAGRFAKAVTPLEPAIGAAEAIHSAPGAASARALLAEAIVRHENDLDRARQLLADAPRPTPGGVAGALVLRARAVLGDDAARSELAAAVIRLQTPGLALDV
ncbi:MAG: adenylate/guanylate cyclase domain-containing protein [Acidimicrobiia bacterium]